ncbi:MAG: C45 family autoproteolytic acyltransferase/hydrolase [Acetatifactor muris]|nr:C45 family autoproteolytic acyltransferase/hydrolase [Acetatifactor muris]
MKNKMCWWKKVLLAVAVLFLLIIIVVATLFWRVIRTAASVEKLENGLYSMEYQGDYHFDGFLEAGGASSDLAVADYVIQDIAYGLVDLHLQGYGFGCSTMSASDGTGGSLFGRNFDWGYCSSMIVRTAPPEGYASISTVNMDFLNIGLDSLSEEMRMRIMSAAAPYAPMDGMNEKGLCVAVLMIEDRPAFSQDTGKPDLTTTTAVRLLLDRAASVEEAVELLSQYDLHASAGMMVHFAIADAAGRSVVVEYIDNEMSVVETSVATNFYLSEGEKYGIGTEETHIRYEILDALLQEQKAFTMEDIRDALDSVSKHNFNSPFASTEWSIVYNQQTGEILYYHREDYDTSYFFRLDKK